MWDRRRFVIRSSGSLVALSAGGICWQALAQNPRLDDDIAPSRMTPATTQAIDWGLRYLQTNQLADGSFGTGNQAGNVAITSLCGLAFMASGSQPGRGPYGQNVTRALEYVLSKKDVATNMTHPRGFLHEPSAFFHGEMYDHGFATLFLAEAHGMASQTALRQRLRTTLEQAVQLIVQAQNHEGGWRYKPVPNDADISVTSAR